MESVLPSGKRVDRLRHVRHERGAFRGRFFEEHADFWPIARAARTFADRDDWPEVEEYASAFEGETPVRFVFSPPRRRRPDGQPVARGDLYDAVIVHRRAVPTRARMWHDYLNALVWATFPRAKLALHGRQHAAIERWIPDGATHLPNARTRELDALALVDEGGVIVLDFGATQVPILFGHALFEGLVLGQPAMIARSVVLDARGLTAESNQVVLRLADTLLAEILQDTARIVSPDELPRRPL
ncbi:MAG TPA: DUF3025 domain-containing protein [Labilithrix sp.]|nr:DUF3025 domain-containing protein [Labilithrix sp.]